MEFDGSIILFFIGFFVGAGIIIIIVWLMNISKSNEFQNPKNELISLTRNAIESAFCDESTKEKLLSKLD